MFRGTSRVLFFLAARFVQGQATSSATPQSVDWFPCDQNASWPVTCGSLTVPWDYTDLDSGKTLNLSLLKVNATREPVKGSILLNPGGPGDLSREFLAHFAEEVLVSTGGYFDLIAFDTRGTGQTIPFSCYGSESDRTTAMEISPQTSNSSDTSLGLAWASAMTLAELCAQTLPEIGQVISTAFVARDMIQIVDALPGDGMLRYYGFSYGTGLGATVAALFPERIDKMVLDGTMNVAQYYAGWDVEQYSQADRALLGFCELCLANPDGCPLATKADTAQVLFSRILLLLETVKYNPTAIGPDLVTDMIKYDPMKIDISNAVRGPLNLWSPLAGYLNAIMDRNLSALHDNYALLYPSGTAIYPNLGVEAVYGIRCSDSALRADSVGELQPLFDQESNVTSWFWDVASMGPLACSQWKLKPKETIDGQSVRAQTKNPILIIGSPVDHVTALASAHNTSTLFPGSVVLQHNGYGHCSIAQPSLCTIQATRAYFVNGTLPKAGTTCEPDFQPFTNHTAAESYSGFV